MLCFSYFVLNIDCRCHVSRLNTTCTSFDFQLFDSTNYPALRFATYLGLREKNISKWIWIKPSTNYWKHTASLMDRWRIIRLSGHLQFNHRTRRKLSDWQWPLWFPSFPAWLPCLCIHFLTFCNGIGNRHPFVHFKGLSHVFLSLCYILGVQRVLYWILRIWLPFNWTF